MKWNTENKIQTKTVRYRRKKEQKTDIDKESYYKLTLTISILALNVNGLTISIKRQRLSDWVKKRTTQDAHICMREHIKCKHS